MIKMDKKMLKFNVRDLFTLFFILVFGWALFEAIDFQRGGQVFPLTVTIPAVILGVIQLLRDMRRRAVGKYDTSRTGLVDVSVDTSIPSRIAFARALRYLLWVVGLYLGIWLFGFKTANVLFFILFLRIEGRARWHVVAFLTALAVYLIFIHLTNVLGLYWPESLLGLWLDIDIPWLF